MPTYTATLVPEGALVKPSTVNPNFTALETVLAGLDGNNIAIKYVSTLVTTTLVPGQTVASFAPHVNDGIYYVRGWDIEQQGFAGIETCTLTLNKFLKSTGGSDTVLDTAPAMVAGSTFTAIDIAVQAIPATHGVRVKVSAGAVPASRTMTVTIHLATLLLASASL